MKLIMTLLVRDEADILAANIDFHLAMGVDHVIATDNLSVDGTTEILRAYERLGVLSYIHESDDDFAQHLWVGRMARRAATEFGADWVINNDADEFWWPTHGNLKDALRAAPETCDALVVPRTNFIPRSTGGERFFADEMTVRERRSFNALGRPLPGKICHRGLADIRLSHGNHRANRGGPDLPTEPGRIEVFHFPVRSLDQFRRKIVNGGGGLARNAYLPQGTGDALRYRYQLWLDGRLEEHYQTLVATDESAARGLRDGTLVVDERLKVFLSGARVLP